MNQIISCLSFGYLVGLIESGTSNCLTDRGHEAALLLSELSLSVFDLWT